MFKNQNIIDSSCLLINFLFYFPFKRRPWRKWSDSSSPWLRQHGRLGDVVRQHGYGRQRLVVTGGNARGLRDIGRFPETDALHGDLTDLTVERGDLVFLCIFAVVDNWILKCFNMLQLNAW